MKRNIVTFLWLSVVFTIGLFFGEWLFDLIFSLEREELIKEMLTSLFVGILTSFLFVFVSGFFKKSG